MKKLLLLIPLLFIVLSIYYFLRIDSRSLEEYVGDWLKSKGVAASSLSCSMNQVAARTGYCTFILSGQTFGAVKSMLKLKKGGNLPFRSEGCAGFINFAKKESLISETPPGPIYPDYSRTSLNRIVYSEKDKAFCLDVEFPYG